MVSKRIFQRAVLLAVFGLLPFSAQAQDGGMMTFSEEETETANEDEMSFGEEEASEESESEESAEDVLSVLGEESEASAGASTEGGVQEAKESGSSHPIWAVQQVYALRKGRVDFQPSFGISMNDPYVQHQSVNLAASYYITEVLAIGASFNYYGFLDAETDLNYQVSRATHQVIPINKYLLGAQLNFSYVPMYGKFAFFKEWILHWDVWVIGGGGFIMTRPEPVIDPEYRTFDFKAKFSFNLGLGGRLFLTRFLAVYLELRDYIYPEELESLTTYQRVEDRQDKSRWTEDSYKLTNNFTLHAGVSLFIPFTFEYKLPK